MRTRLAIAALVSLIVPAAMAGPAPAKSQHKKAEPLVIAHRGASGYRPEHTLAAYALGARMGADYIEPDLVSTKDGVLVARHENEISATTDVADHPEFATRRTTKTIDGVALTGWFTEDFTLAELKTLRAKERIPELRPRNTLYNGRYEIPTFQEVIDLAERLSDEAVGIYPETKHPTYFRTIGLPLEKPLVARAEALRRPARSFIQSFEVGNLKALDREIDPPLVQLLAAKTARPVGFDRTYGEMATPAGLKEIAQVRRRRRPVEGLHRPARRDRPLARAHHVRPGRPPRRPASSTRTRSATRTPSCRSSCAARPTRRPTATPSPSTSSSSRSASTACSPTTPTPRWRRARRLVAVDARSARPARPTGCRRPPSSSSSSAPTRLRRQPRSVRTSGSSWPRRAATTIGARSARAAISS